MNPTVREIPCLTEKQGKTVWMVDGKPFMGLGGEMHNSSGSDPQYMDEKIWPSIRALHGNCFLTPVYWECVEREKDHFDFSLVDAVIAQAERENVRLVLLWFGLWKNGDSWYTPVWMKEDPRYFFMRRKVSKLMQSVSPFCREAVERDALAFTRLMEHLRDTDTNRTVIMVQVENEVGSWGTNRDYCKAAEEIFQAEIPPEIAELFKTSGTWREAFGDLAEEYFMAYAFSSAVGRIVREAHALYPLPLFMNAVTQGVKGTPGAFCSGGPIPRVQAIWRRMAPEIALYAPDIYSPDYQDMCEAFAATGPLAVPELSCDRNACARAMYTAAAFNTLLFSPFGIEDIFEGSTEQDRLSRMNTDLGHEPDGAGELLAESYLLIQALQEDIFRARETDNCFAFLEDIWEEMQEEIQEEIEEEMQEDMPEKNHEKIHEKIHDKIRQEADGQSRFITWDNIRFRVSFGHGGIRDYNGRVGHRREDRPQGGGFILRQGKGRYILCGVSFNVEFEALRENTFAFIAQKRELVWRDGKLTLGRMLNGDERDHTVIGSRPAAMLLDLYTRDR